jgi:hypothetical protein
MKPVWVKVEWSESNKFQDNELVPFEEFEKRCRNVARKTGSNNGYTKTKCEILFDNGARYGLRLDLAENDDHGFEDRAKKTIAWYENQEATGKMDEYVEFLKKVDWS